MIIFRKEDIENIANKPSEKNRMSHLFLKENDYNTIKDDIEDVDANEDIEVIEDYEDIFDIFEVVETKKNKRRFSIFRDLKEYNIKMGFENRVHALSYIVMYFFLITFVAGVLAISIAIVQLEIYTTIFAIVTGAFLYFFYLIPSEAILAFKNKNNVEYITKPELLQKSLRKLIVLIVIFVALISFSMRYSFFMFIPDIFFCLILIKLFSYYNKYPDIDSCPKIKDYEGKEIYTLFDKWDPIKAYGRFIIISSATLLSYNFFFEDTKSIVYIFVNIFCITSIITAVLFIKKIEIGRLLMIIHHIAWPVIYFTCFSIERARFDSIPLFLRVYGFLLIYWNYFVIRTLCTKVVKYNFMFGRFHDKELSAEKVKA